MKASARHILDEAEREPLPGSLAEALGGKVNALEGSPGLDDVVPSAWTAEHVCKRVVEAFETLSRLPPERGPREPGNSWMPYQYTWEDKLAQADVSAAELRARERARNRVQVRATAEYLRRLDVVMGWLSRLYQVDRDLGRDLQSYAHLRGTGRSVKEWCRDNHLSFQTVYRRRDKAAAIIVGWLGGAPVW